MRSTTLGTALLSLSIVFAFIGVLFSNISWVILCIAFVGSYIYAHRRFSSELARTNLQIDRKILDEMTFSQEPVSVQVEALNKDPITVRGTFVDMMPDDCTLASGSNRATMILPPRSILRLSYSMIPTKRGPHTIRGMRIDRVDAFGLFSEEQMIEQASDLNVHTEKTSFDTARKMAGREHLEFSGIGRNPAVVLREFEFDGIREYVPGDRARDIQWKLLPKLNKLMTKTYRKEGAVQTMVLVDCGRSMRLKTHKVAKIDHAVDLSMQLSNVLISSYHPTGVATFDELLINEKVMPALGRHQFERIVKMLRSVPGAVETLEATSTSGIATQPKTAGPASVIGRAGQGDDFLSALGNISGSVMRKRLGYGLDGGIKEIISKSRGREQLFIVISDLVSSRDAILAGAKLCQATKNRMLVVSLFDDWYKQTTEEVSLPQIEKMYGNLEESLRIEAGLRGLGATYIRVGPADTASGIARAIRRGRT